MLWSFCTFWPFANNHPAIFLVVIGVVGETVFDWNKKKEVKERLKKFFAFMLIVGLVWEIPEASENDKKAADAKERVEMLEFSNAVLSAQLTTLESTNLAVRLQVAGLHRNNLLLQSNVTGLDKQVVETKIELARANERTAFTESNNLVLRKEIVDLELQLAKIDPINLPIVLATAEVSFFAFGTNAMTIPKVRGNPEIDKMLVRMLFKDPNSDDFPVFLTCESIEKDALPPGPNSGFLVRLTFKSNSLGAEWRLTPDRPKLDKWDNLTPSGFDEFKYAEISVPELSAKAGIRGTCSIVLNSTVVRNFSIDSQSSTGKIVLRRSGNGP